MAAQAPAIGTDFEPDLESGEIAGPYAGKTSNIDPRTGKLVYVPRGYVPARPAISADFERDAAPIGTDFEPDVPTSQGEIAGGLHRVMNDFREFGNAAGKYIFDGLGGLSLEQAKIFANPPPELTATQAEEVLLPRDQQVQREEERRAAAQSKAPQARATAEYWRRRAAESDQQSGVDPQLVQSWDARISRASGSAAIMGMEGLIPYAGLPMLALHGAAATEAEARNAGKSDQEAEKSAVRSLIGLGIFGGTNKVAALGLAKLLPEGSSTLTKFVTQFLGQDAANEASSRAINAWEAASNAKPGEKIRAATKALSDTSLETSTLNAVYAGIGAAHQAARRGVKMLPIGSDFEPELKANEVSAAEEIRSPVAAAGPQDRLETETGTPEITLATAPKAVPFRDDPGLPFMVKSRMEDQLRQIGKTEQEIAQMTGRDVTDLIGPSQPESPSGAQAITEATAVRSSPPAIERALTEEEIARQEYEREMQEQMRGPQPGEGQELLEAIRKAGGLPSKSNRARELFRGEVDNLEETARATPSLNKIGLFRTDAPNLDELATRLRDRGFPIQTPQELIEILNDRLRTGRQIYALPPEIAESGRVFAQGGTAPRARAGAVLTHKLQPGDIISWRGERRTIGRIAGAKTELKQFRGSTYPSTGPVAPGEQPTVKLEAQHYIMFDNGDYIAVNRPARITRYGSATQIRSSEGATQESAQASTKTVPIPGATRETRIHAYGASTPKAARAVTQESAGTLPEAAKELHRTIPQLTAGRPAAPKIAGEALDPLIGPKRLTQLIHRAAFGKEYAARRQADAAMQTFKKDFDRTPVPRGWQYVDGQPLPRNYEVQRAIDVGDMNGLTTHEQAFAATMRRLFDESIGAVQEVSPNSLRDLYETYFPRLWQEPKRNGELIRQWMGRRPLEGPKSFLKQRAVGDWLDGIRMGLRPAFDNPVDMAMAKLGEMWRFVGARTAFGEMKANGLRKFIYAFERAPDGWREVNDPSSKVYAPPFVTIPEAFDEQLRVKTMEFLKSLGVPQERLAKLGGKRWGTYESAQGIRTKFAGPLSVYWHELGHGLEERYHFLDVITRGEAKANLAGRSEIENQLRKLADLRVPEAGAPTSFQKYIRTKDEKAAVILEAYLHAPERMREVAPNVYTRFKKFISEHPELRDIERIRPGVALGTGKQQFALGGFVQLGRWMSPEPAARVLETIISPGIQSRTWYRGLRAINGLLTSVRLAGFFHGGMVTNDSQYAAIGLAINDVLAGHPVRGIKEILKSPLMLPRAYRLGQKIMKAIDFPDNADAQTKMLAQTAIDANLRSHIGAYDITMARMWRRALNEAVSSPSIGAAWEAFWRAPFAVASKAMAPVMEHLVPQMKYGMSGMQAARILADHPDADPMLLRDLFAKSVDSVEDRIGQVTYDNLFMNRAVKDVAQLGLTAFGWHLTKYRGVFGGAADWTRAAKAVATGKTPEITYRMTYLPAMVIGHALIGGTIHYLMTGKRPDKALDYLFPETGLVDQLGRPVRLAIADYVKDLAYEWTELRQHGLPGLVGAQVTRLAPVWNMAAEMYRNADFYNVKIFSERQPGEPEMEHLLTNLGEGVKYIGQSATPFSTRAGTKLQQAKMGAVESYLLPFFGIVPARQMMQMTPAQVLAQDLFVAKLPRGAMDRDKFNAAQAVKKVVSELRTNDPGAAKDMSDAIGKGEIDPGKLTAVIMKSQLSPFQFQIKSMSAQDAMKVWDLASPAEREQLRGLIALKLANSKTVTPEQRIQYYRMIMQRPPAAQPTPAKKLRFSLRNGSD